MNLGSLNKSIKLNLLGLIKTYILTRKFIIHSNIHPVYGTSMMPTLNDGDFISYSDNNYLHRGDIVSFVAIKDYNRIETLVKRVIGLPGDTLIIRDSDGAILNSDNIFIPEKYTLRPNLKLLNDKVGNKSHKITIPKNHIYVLGDNRFNSKDSREFGAVSTKLVIGKVNLVRVANNDYKIKHLINPNYKNLTDDCVNFKFSFLFILKLALFSIFNKHKRNDT